MDRSFIQLESPNLIQFMENLQQNQAGVEQSFGSLYTAECDGVCRIQDHVPAESGKSQSKPANTGQGNKASAQNKARETERQSATKDQTKAEDTTENTVGVIANPFAMIPLEAADLTPKKSTGEILLGFFIQSDATELPSEMDVNDSLNLMDTDSLRSTIFEAENETLGNLSALKSDEAATLETVRNILRIQQNTPNTMETITQEETNLHEQEALVELPYEATKSSTPAEELKNTSNSSAPEILSKTKTGIESAIENQSSQTIDAETMQGKPNLNNETPFESIMARLESMPSASMVSKEQEGTAKTTSDMMQNVSGTQRSTAQARAAAKLKETLPQQSQVPVDTLDESLFEAKWGKILSDKMVQLATQGNSKTVLFLDPPELGPLEVSIELDADNTHITFSSQHAQVREILQDNSDRLKGAFQEQGLPTLNVSVSDRESSYAEQQNNPPARVVRQAETAIEGDNTTDAPASDNVIDTFV